LTGFTVHPTAKQKIDNNMIRFKRKIFIS